MNRDLVLAVGASALGAIVTVASVTDGLRLSWSLLLGLLLLADGVLRFQTIREEGGGE